MVKDTLMVIVADRYTSAEAKEHLERDCGQKCRLGFNWWFWFPNISIDKWNIDVALFCFMVVYIRKAAR